MAVLWSPVVRDEQGILPPAAVGDRIAAVRELGTTAYALSAHHHPNKRQARLLLQPPYKNNAVKCFHVFFNFVVWNEPFLVHGANPAGRGSGGAL